MNIEELKYQILQQFGFSANPRTGSGARCFRAVYDG